MSVPRQNTVWGKFLLDTQELGVLSGRYLNETIENEVNEFIKDQKPFAKYITAPWLNNKPQWEIEDDKLYLTDIGLSVDMSKSHTVEYQDKERVEPIEGLDGEKSELRIGRRKIISSNDDRSNMQKIFGVDRIFAEWVNEPMKLLVKESKQKPVIVDKGDWSKKTLYEVTMDLVVLEFENGTLKSRSNIQESYRTALKNYIEEID